MKRKLLSIIYNRFPLNSIRRKALILSGNYVGDKVYIGEGLIIISNKKYATKVHFGDRSVLAPRVTLITVSGANNSILSTYLTWKAGDINLGDDCWIGTGAVIYPGITIGKCSIVNANAVVTKDVPDYTIVGGVPAIEIKKLNIK